MYEFIATQYLLYNFALWHRHDLERSWPSIESDVEAERHPPRHSIFKQLIQRLALNRSTLNRPVTAVQT